MRAIAQRIEYTPTAIYHHFKDKDALIIELCHSDFARLGRQFTQMERIEDPVERLRRIGMAYVEFAIHNPHHYQIMFMTRTPVHEHPEKNPEEDAYGFLLQTVEEGLAAGRFRPELADAHELAQMTWSSVHGIISLQIAKCHDPWVDWRDLRTTAKAIIDALIRGILREGQQA
jgi:AcrR family transcriptional regulator